MGEYNPPPPTYHYPPSTLPTLPTPTLPIPTHLHPYLYLPTPTPYLPLPTPPTPHPPPPLPTTTHPHPYLLLPTPPCRPLPTPPCMFLNNFFKANEHRSLGPIFFFIILINIRDKQTTVRDNNVISSYLFISALICLYLPYLPNTSSTGFYNNVFADCKLVNRWELI